MDCYFCIVNTPGVYAREIIVLKANADDEARAALSTVADQWIGYDTLCLYQGERVVEVRSNPGLGFPQDPLEGIRIPLAA
ncbi:hypothetical protein ABIE19_000605 [Brevundimonas faecalis]|uniref:Uncharacterized protein n=1 Tax=Brevundimonas faecalis TaxID=947378 RepID=A0ABV2R7Y3_9CAUL